MTRILVYLALSVPGPDEIEWTNASANIPIMYAEGRKAEIRQLVLYMSTDRGGSWTQTAVAQPGQEHFRFTATKNGPYWFVLVIETQDGKREPAEVNRAEPGLKMHVRVGKKQN
jgi:hypothetical protein